MATDAQMREAIAAVYSGRKWKLRVARMDETQVFAVYQDFLRKGKFDKKPNQSPSVRPSRKEKHEERQFKAYTGIQLSFFDEM